MVELQEEVKGLQEEGTLGWSGGGGGEELIGLEEEGEVRGAESLQYEFDLEEEVVRTELGAPSAGSTGQHGIRGRATARTYRRKME